jgi:O-antigen ligase
MQVRTSLTLAGQPAVSADVPLPAAPPKRWIEANPDSDIALKLAFIVVSVEILMATSRALEILATDFGFVIPYLGVAIYAVALLVTLVSGRLPAIATSRAGIFMLAFTGWLLLITPLSQWRGGSVDMLLHEWLPSTIGFLSCGVIVTMGQCRQIAKVLSASVVFVASASVLFSTTRLGRLSMEQGTLGNANDLSMLLLLGVPFLLVPIFRRGAGPGIKILTGLASLGALVITVRTGSRSGLLSLMAMLLVLFLALPFAGKLKLGLTTLLLTAALLLSAPDYVLSRYATTFSDPTTVADLHNEAYGSKIVRQQLFKESVDLTLANPIFGVGPGIFIAAEAIQAEQEGRRAQWRVSHNSFTQVSSETGFPGLILYVGALWTAFANILWIRKNAAKDPSGWASVLSLALLISLVGTTVNFIFSSNAYMVYLPVLIGLSVGFRGAAEREFAMAAAPVPATVPVPAPSAPDIEHVATDSRTVRGLVSKAMPSLADAPPAQGHRYRFLGRPRRLSH